MLIALALAAAALAADAAAPVAPQPFLGLFQDPPPADGPPAEPEWTGTVSAGGAITTGNSETRQGNATADAELRRAKDRWTLGFLWIYSEEKNTTGDWNLTDRRTSAKAKYDYFLTEKTYLLAQTSAESDEESDLELRWTVGVGAGRQFIEDERTKLSAEAGLSWVDEEYKNDEESFLAARGAYNAERVLTKALTFAQTGEIYPSLEDQDDVYAKVDTRLKIGFSENLIGQLQWVFDWDNTPAQGADRVDNRFLASVGWKF